MLDQNAREEAYRGLVRTLRDQGLLSVDKAYANVNNVAHALGEVLGSKLSKDFGVSSGVAMKHEHWSMLANKAHTYISDLIFALVGAAVDTNERISADKQVVKAYEFNGAGTRPPVGMEDEFGYHWFKSERASSPGFGWWDKNQKAWKSTGEAGFITPDELKRRGWEYLCPVQMPVYDQ